MFSHFASCREMTVKNTFLARGILPSQSPQNNDKIHTTILFLTETKLLLSENEKVFKWSRGGRSSTYLHLSSK